ncbi:MULTISPECIES: hypothetical protein [unclassified Sphingobium]|uniref:hypothetical protein n=1 Tax=unclassified Sphingobium TaxID=2611147 RepID=UPI00076FECCF|nr:MULTISPECIES: hypothetical protein [unclassified Sphingobium]AMK16842.1 hypothetical protein K663_02265 [Sphingobium sp. MI1205]ANI78192.1 hypothetical protein EP837_01780 [Sphingobium sp. EP60837]
MNKIPVAALVEGHIVTLEGDRFVDPRSDVAELTAPLTVVGHHAGIPTAQDELRAYKLIGDRSDVAAEDVPEQACTLLLVTPAPSTKLLVAYFPDDQHEVPLDVDDQDELE